jgi:MYXO-CTERM domain-containing protein
MGVLPADAEPTACSSNTGGGRGDTCPAQTSRSFDLNPSSLGLGYGESIGLTVIAVDEAENRSAIGEVTCLTRVMTIGLCDSVECKGGCQCHAPGSPSGRSGPAAAAILALLGGVHYRRRRRRHRSRP